MSSYSIPRAVAVTLIAAALFGAATPVGKLLLGATSAFMVAGLFYLGSGVGLGIVTAVRRWGARRDGVVPEPLIQRAQAPWLAGAIIAGGVAGPALLMLGLSTTPAATSSLLLNLEGVLTAVIAWVVFRENVDTQVFLGMVAIVAGGVVLSWYAFADHALARALPRYSSPSSARAGQSDVTGSGPSVFTPGRVCAAACFAVTPSRRPGARRLQVAVDPDIAAAWSPLRRR